ncbi:hypothetical protein [Metabacillus fastidiosus]|uniref:hypothetical protein n=1 Tax=Metabacillus fastidiosus TaxID=1458 RepID=UPI002E24DBB3|nr:hypothetical protein [Metabacillus fastidiosus]
MPYYQVKEVHLLHKEDKYSIYHNNEEKEIKLNEGFSTAKSILEAMYLLTTKDDPISFYYYYHNGKLEIFLKNEERNLLPGLQININECEWENGSPQLETMFAYEKISLKGCASPLVIKDREENLIDELINRFPNKSFLIQVKVMPKEDRKAREEIRKLMKHIKKLLQGLDTKDEEKVKEEFFKENGCRLLTKNSIKEQLEILENHVNTLNTQGFLFESLEYNIYAEDEIAKEVALKMKEFSKRIENSSLYYLRTEQYNYSLEYLNYIPVNFVASILALPLKNVPQVEKRKRLEMTNYENEWINKMKQYNVNFSVNISQRTIPAYLFTGKRRRKIVIKKM